MSEEECSGDLMSRLDNLSSAEPMSAEDDLILRMQAVSKVRSRKGGSTKDKAAKSPLKASKSIKKRSPKPRKSSSSMQL